MDSLERKKGGSLRLTAEIFTYLHEALIKNFSEYYSVDVAFLSRFQLYGFDHYDDTRPNFSSYIHIRTNIWVNGKYLYKKVRDLYNGKREIKLTRQYVYIYFQVLGYKDVFDFIHSSLVGEDSRQRQLQLCGLAERVATDNQYYVGYYFGEDADIIKTCLTLYNNFTEVMWELIYWEGKQPSNYLYRGLVRETKTTIALYFKAEHSTTERNAFISIFYGNRNVVNRPFLFGTYSGFDRNDCPVAGEIIFQRVLSKEEQEKVVYSKEVDFAIRDLITNKRIVTSAVLPQQKFELSQESLYATRLSIYAGSYTGYVASTRRGELTQLRLMIKQGSNQAQLIFDDGRVYKGYFRVTHQGVVLRGWFGPLFPFHEFSLLLNSTLHQKKYIFGVYSGITTKGQPSAGKICFARDSHVEDMPRGAPEDLSLVLSGGRQQDDHAYAIFRHYLFSGHGSIDFPVLTASESGVDPVNLYNGSGHVVHGTYEVYYWSEDRTYIVKDLLHIGEDGKVLLNTRLCLAEGIAELFKDGILSICVDWCGAVQIHLRFLIFVGRYGGDEIRAMSGISSAVSKSFTPMAQKVVFVRTDAPFDSQKSKKYNPKGKFIHSLRDIFSGFNDLVCDPSFLPIRTIQSINWFA